MIAQNLFIPYVVRDRLAGEDPLSLPLPTIDANAWALSDVTSEVLVPSLKVRAPMFPWASTKLADVLS